MPCHGIIYLRQCEAACASTQGCIDPVVSALDADINNYRNQHPSLYVLSLTFHPLAPSWAFRNVRE